MKNIVLDAGNGVQRDFVKADARFSAYIGGVGSGKTFAGLVKGLEASQQTMFDTSRVYGPRGCVAASTYPNLKDAPLTAFFELMDGTDLWKWGTEENSYVKSEKKAILKANCGCANRRTCKHKAEILFRSLDAPDQLRGPEFTWFFVDEGRNVDINSWNILLGRLRQQGYRHQGWVCSTPNGMDWMFDLFAPDSDSRIEDSVWFQAETDQNPHLPPEYVRSMRANWHGDYFDQEFRGFWVGSTSGAVYPHWTLDLKQTLEFDPKLMLVTGWDFGVGDLGICLFAQVDYEKADLGEDEGFEWLPVLKFVGEFEHTDWGASEWAAAYNSWLEGLREKHGRIRPTSNWGDPAGAQRWIGSGTTVFDAWRAYGVDVLPAPKRPWDHGVLLLDNMMAGRRVLVDPEKCPRLAKAFAKHKFPTDDEGNRTSNKPVRDWTVHYSDAARYLASGLLSFTGRRGDKPEPETYPPGTAGWYMEQLLNRNNGGEWIGRDRKAPLDWPPVDPVGVS